MQILKLTFINIFLFSIFLSPALAQTPENSGLIPCGQRVTTTTTNPTTHQQQTTSTIPKDNECDFQDFMHLLNNIVNFIFKDLALPIAAIMFAYAGFTMITAGGGECKTKAKRIFANALWGLVLAAAAWIIVKSLLTIAGYNDAVLFF